MERSASGLTLMWVNSPDQDAGREVCDALYEYYRKSGYSFAYALDGEYERESLPRIKQFTIFVSNLEPLPQYNQAMEDLLQRMRTFVAGFCAARKWEYIQ